MADYVRYTDDIEQLEDGEAETIQKIVEVMTRTDHVTHEKYGHSVRVSHGKAHGLLKGELRVLDGLPDSLRQGIFASQRSYPVIARLAAVPGEILDDRGVSTPRGLALKVMNVEGPMIPGHEGNTTQDWVLDTGKVFQASTAKVFLAQFSGVGPVAPKTPEVVKHAVSDISRITNDVLNAVGVNSANLDFFGHHKLHPLAEAYFSQTPLRWGDYIAKLAIVPDSADLKLLIKEKFDINNADGLRTAVIDFFHEHGAQFAVDVQLCTDLKKMPVEDAHAEWSETESPYQTVGRLIFPPQDAYSAARADYVEEDLAFSPSHSLQAHRPLGSLNRARMVAYKVLGDLRRQRNGRTLEEPRSIDQLPQ